MTVFTITDNTSASGHSGDLTITSIVFASSNTCTVIAANAFSNCTNLTSIDFTNATLLQAINSDAFAECDRITGPLVLPNSVVTIGTTAFRRCASITSLTLSNTLNEIGQAAFINCASITGTLVIPNSVVILREAVSSFVSIYKQIFDYYIQYNFDCFDQKNKEEKLKDALKGLNVNSLDDPATDDDSKRAIKGLFLQHYLNVCHQHFSAYYLAQILTFMPK